MLKGMLFMKYDFKTGEKCDKPGNYLLIETGEIMEVVKGDVFPGYYQKIRDHETGAPIYDTTREKRAHFKLLK
ncbi:MAG: hypothetical protein IIC11_09895 [Proteobacteria bacterium]|nr:hypothetical protein [Pseudomonadota bacterium]